ncbi:E3 ubiquitin-protein ligase TRIM71-like [Stylophora pistillata]|uniref:E3 ubiquitin-protein ligase TRIM71-like n=1 Tax=Stylophora pistillata TaxID=50429 RepID=UPI000C0521EF|nr:E3 ubiquitin-protein ligase TRIM71-like [Stylophora pistillata]
MQNKKNVEERIEDLMKTTMPVLPVNSFVEFVSTYEPESLSLGFTKFSKTDVQGSTVEGLVKNFRFGVETELLIRPKTSEGEIRNTRHTDRIEVHIGPADQVTSLVTSEREDGGFQTKFVAKVPGTYEMELKINEQKLAKSPFSIFLKSREFDVIGKLDSHGEMLQGPTGIAVNSKGVTAVADVDGHCIMVFDDTGKFVLTLGVYGDKVGQFDNPTDVTFVNDDEILVADECNHRIQRFNIQTGKCVKSFGKEGSGDGKLKFPTSVCITSDGRFIVVVDNGNSRIQMFTMDGKPVLKFGDGGPERLDQPLGCVCYEDKFIVTDRKNDCVKVFDEEGQFLYKFGEKGNGDGQLAQPYGLCTDKDGNVLVCDMLNNRIQMFSLEGKFIRKTSTDLKIQFPWGVTTTPDGQILVTDYNGLEVYTLK